VFIGQGPGVPWEASSVSMGRPRRPFALLLSDVGRTWPLTASPPRAFLPPRPPSRRAPAGRRKGQNEY
jgi:hypothetical protein